VRVVAARRRMGVFDDLLIGNFMRTTLHGAGPAPGSIPTSPVRDQIAPTMAGAHRRRAPRTLRHRRRMGVVTWLRRGSSSGRRTACSGCSRFARVPRAKLYRVASRLATSGGDGAEDLGEPRRRRREAHRARRRSGGVRGAARGSGGEGVRRHRQDRAPCRCGETAISGGPVIESPPPACRWPAPPPEPARRTRARWTAGQARQVASRRGCRRPVSRVRGSGRRNRAPPRSALGRAPGCRSPRAGRRAGRPGRAHVDERVGPLSGSRRAPRHGRAPGAPRARNTPACEGANSAGSDTRRAPRRSRGSCAPTVRHAMARSATSGEARSTQREVRLDHDLARAPRAGVRAGRGPAVPGVQRVRVHDVDPTGASRETQHGARPSGRVPDPVRVVTGGIEASGPRAASPGWRTQASGDGRGMAM
jgi:hypothetical protein